MRMHTNASYPSRVPSPRGSLSICNVFRRRTPAQRAAQDTHHVEPDGRARPRRVVGAHVDRANRAEAVCGVERLIRSVARRKPRRASLCVGLPSRSVTGTWGMPDRRTVAVTSRTSADA